MNLRVTILFWAVLVTVTTAHAWEVDWSRRQKHPDPAPPSNVLPSKTTDTTTPTTTATTTDLPVAADPAAPGAPAGSNGTLTGAGTYISPGGATGKVDSTSRKRYLEGLVQPSHQVYTGDRQEFVILNTAKGFVPSNVRLHKGLHYIVHVVNVNEDKKNVSFMLDAFNQHYATYFGQIKSFNLDPDKEGIYDFQCPETNSSGKLVVFGPGGMSPARTLSSEQH